MLPEEAERVAEMVERALEVSAEERCALVAKLCANDAGLQREVESLLGFQEQARHFIETPAYEKCADLLVDDQGELKPGILLGDCRIISLIGEGGMGEVYLAEDTKLERRVAIKLLKFGLGTVSIVRHFQQEQRILAGLTHPNIARLYGGDVTANGLPYFVMEYVEGMRLDDYCREQQLPVEERLALFRKICGAVSYAHQRLVIHRDIKPANIRVTAEGEPKLLDFGIARLLDPATSTVPEMTMTLAAVMTPDYASPEQVRGETITTASDIYSLGVVLYELLTGQKPYKMEHRSPANLARAVTEQEPTRPSRIVTSTSNSQVAGRKGTHRLGGDLDNIVMKALRKEAERRYASVGQFSEDIRRYLEGRPVIARKDTVAYRTSKFIARNRVAVAAGVVIFLAIIAGLVASLWEARSARRERDVAQGERLKAQQISTFLQEMIGAAAPEVKGIDTKLVDVLGEASRRASQEAVSHPEMMADVLMTLGRTYISIGLFDAAVTDLKAARAAGLKANGELNATTATSMAWLGLGLVFQGKADEAEIVSRKAVELQRKLHPGGSADLGVALYSLGLALVGKNEAKEGEPALREASELIKRFTGEKQGYYLATLTSLGNAREALGDHNGAEGFYRRAIEIGRTVEPRYRIYLAQAAVYLGDLLINRRSYAEAESTLREAEAAYREILGESNSSLPVVQMRLGKLYRVQGDYVRSETEYRKALEIIPKYFAPNHFVRVGAIGGLGVTLTRGGKAAEGEKYLREALEIRRKTLPPGDFMIPFTESALGESLLVQEHYEEAEKFLTSGYAGMKLVAGDKDERVTEGRQFLVRMYEAWGKPKEADRYR